MHSITIFCHFVAHKTTNKAKHRELLILHQIPVAFFNRDRNHPYQGFQIPRKHRPYVKRPGLCALIHNHCNWWLADLPCHLLHQFVLLHQPLPDALDASPNCDFIEFIEL